MARSSTIAEKTSGKRSKRKSSSSKRKSGSSKKATASKRRAGKARSSAAGGAFTPENRRFVLFLGLLTAWGLTVLSLASYSSLDPAFSRRSSVEEIRNWCGRWGALLSDMLYQLLGWSSWMVLPLGVWIGLRFARRPSATIGRLISGLLGCWWFATLFGLIWFPDPGTPYPHGGALGASTAEWLLANLGPAGSYLSLAALMIVGLTVALDINWERLAGRGVDVVHGSSPAVADGARRVAVAAARGGAWVGQGLAGRARARLSRASRSIRRQLEEAPSRASRLEPEVQEVEGGVVDAVRFEIPEEPALAMRLDHTDTFVDLGFGPDRDVPTVHSERALVEVEVDVTSPEEPAAPRTDLPEAAPSAPSRPDAALSELAAAPRVADRSSADDEGPSSFVEESSTPGEPSVEPVQVITRRPEPSGEGAPSAERRHTPPPPSQAAIEPGNLVSGGDDGEDLIRWPESSEDPFELPSLSLLDTHDRSVGVLDENALREMAAALVSKLADFGIKGEVTAIRPGPVITIFEYLPAPGVKVRRIASLTDDIAMAMRAIRVRIVAPIPGKGVVGIEIPNKKRQIVWYRDVLASPEFRDNSWVLPMALGKTPTGKPLIADLAKMPHLLVGGTTGSGKSVGVNSMLMTMLFSRSPEELRLILIDPKMLEFELYNDIPHLLHPVVTEPRLAAAALQWACKEMDDRYRVLARWGTRNIASYNKKVDREKADWSERKARRYRPRKYDEEANGPYRPRRFSYIVVVIDELADLMMVASKEVEEAIVRLAQKARACGIHLIVATQRPSVDVITGLIKANMPARIAFQVRSKTDGRTILDQNGAETLLGKGDMLYLPPGVSGLQRLHGPFVSDEEVERVADYLREQAEPVYDADIELEDDSGGGLLDDEEVDEVYDLAVQLVCEQGKASTSMIQRRLRIGYNRAARIMDMMEREGVVGPADGSRPREVLAQPV